jgi:ABC-type Fe3+-siderophore transport system permease subunit
MEFPGLGKALIVAGVVIALAGVAVTFAGKIPFLGKLPGDITWKRGNSTFYFPIATSIVLSIIASVVMYVLSRFAGRR